VRRKERKGINVKEGAEGKGGEKKRIEKEKINGL